MEGHIARFSDSEQRFDVSAIGRDDERRSVSNSDVGDVSVDRADLKLASAKQLTSAFRSIDVNRYYIVNRF